MNTFKKNFNSYIESYFKDNFKNSYFKESLFYSMSIGGKRLRPWIIYEIGKTQNIKDEVLMQIGFAVELLHTASLIHDDLPSIDDSNLRRGHETNHIKFNDFTAILAGDYGFIHPYKLFLNVEINDKAKLKLINSFLNTELKLFEGEMNDVAFEKYNLTPNISDIFKMYENKTGVLFGFCFAAPFFISNDEKKAFQLYNAGVNFGVAFQLFDDLKDLNGNTSILGKNINKDQNKPTILKYFGEQKTIKKANELFDSCIETLKIYELIEFSDKLLNIKKLVQER